MSALTQEVGRHCKWASRKNIGSHRFSRRAKKKTAAELAAVYPNPIKLDAYDSDGHGTRRDKMKQSKRKKEFKSEFSYNRLWKMLIDRNMKKGELQEISDVSAASIAKIGRCENVTTDVLLRICEALDCNIEDIMERIPLQQDKEKNA